MQGQRRARRGGGALVLECRERGGGGRGARRESWVPAPASAHVDAHVTAVRACVTRAEGGAGAEAGAARRRGVGSESALSEAEGVPMYERHSACVSAHVDARVTAVRARVIHAEGDT